jgi:hypothetical protein
MNVCVLVHCAVQRYGENSRQRLDMAVLGFFQNFRKVYIGEQVRLTVTAVTAGFLVFQQWPVPCALLMPCSPVPSPQSPVPSPLESGGRGANSADASMCWAAGVGDGQPGGVVSNFRKVYIGEQVRSLTKPVDGTAALGLTGGVDKVGWCAGAIA